MVRSDRISNRGIKATEESKRLLTVTQIHKRHVEAATASKATDIAQVLPLKPQGGTHRWVFFFSLLYGGCGPKVSFCRKVRLPPTSGSILCKWLLQRKPDTHAKVLDVY